jgi:hypothetical protein
MSELPEAFHRLEHEVAGILAGYSVDEGAPVELAITRIALPGPPQFTGYIRDIDRGARSGATGVHRAQAG